MESVFLHLLNMSITAGWLVLAVLLLRLVFRKAPKWIHCLLWVLVAVRLVCPFSFESVLSLIPSSETVPVDTFLYDTPSIHSGVPVVDGVVNPILSNGLAPAPSDSVNPTQVITYIASIVWLAGIGGMLLYAVISTLRLRLRVREAAYVRENIWQCDRISTPFILGIIRPRIYLPTLLGAEEARSVIAHEQAHLARRDHWWKPLGFLLLTVYWFNPLLWLGYVLLCRDIEAACDERVVRNMDADGRREYSRVLLSCSAPRRLITACPLAFGETGVKSRIKSVLNYKKPAFWLIIAAIVATVAAAVCLLTNPRSTVSEDLDTFLTQAILEENQSQHTGDAYPTEAHTVFGVEKSYGHTTVYGMVLYEEYYLGEDGSLEIQSGSHIPTVITVDTTEDGSYCLVDYWIPRDGSDYASDIRNKFPARHQGKALDTDGYYEQHHAKTLAAAREHFAAVQQASVGFSDSRTFSNMRWMSDAKLDVLYKDVPAEKAEQYLPIIPMTTRDELNAFAKEYEKEMDFDRAEGDALTPAHQLDFYDDAFFAEKVLLAVYYRDGSCSVAPQIVRVSVGDNGATLTVLVDVYEPYAQDMALGQWFLLCEVDRSATKNVTQYYAMVRGHIAADTYAASFADPVEDPTIACEEWRERLSDEEQSKLREIAQGLAWTDEAVFSRSFLFTGCYNLDGRTYYVSMDYDALFDGEQIALLNDEDKTYFATLLMPRGGSTSVTPYPDANDSRDPNTFVGRVIRVTDGSMLMDCYDKNKFTTVWVNLQNYPELNPQVGEEYVVTHSGQVMETYPPQVTAELVTHVSSTPLTTTTQVQTTVSTTSTSSPGSSANLSFTGRVKAVEGERVLMECYDKNKFDTVWVSIVGIKEFTPQKGQEYVVTYENLVMPTLPPIITAVTMELAE